MTLAEITELLTRLRHCYPNTVTDKTAWVATVTQYSAVLCRYPDDAVRRAFDVAWLEHDQWMPSLGQLVRLVERLMPDAHPTEAEGWEDVRRIARGSRAKHDDPLLASVIRDLGGHSTLKNKHDHQMDGPVRAEFREKYRKALSDERIGISAKRLPGAS